MPKITIVIATYNRPELLRCTIQSVIAQTIEDWVLLVVGDCCGPETAEVVASFGDERLFYVNLTERCGEQSGPNTAGMYAAQTRYVAFANHDDVWLPDHLKRALDVLEAEGAEFYAAAAAISVTAKDQRLGDYRLGFLALTPPDRSVEAGFDKSPAYFEPVSSWVMRRDLLKKVGAWRPAALLYRTPLEDWILRAWRAGVAMVFGNAVTTIYCNGNRNMQAEGDISYAGGAAESEHWLDEISHLGADRFRERIQKDVDELDNGGRVFEHTMRHQDDFWVYERLQNKDMLPLYREFGWDGFDVACRLSGKERGFRLRRMLKRRTGEALPVKQDWKSASHFVKSVLGDDNRWKRVNSQ